MVDVSSFYNTRYLALTLEDDEEAKASPWWTASHQRLTQMGSLRAPISWAKAPAEGVLELIARYHEDVEVDLGEEGEDPEEAAA